MPSGEIASRKLLILDIAHRIAGGESLSCEDVCRLVGRDQRDPTDRTYGYQCVYHAIDYLHQDGIAAGAIPLRDGTGRVIYRKLDTASRFRKALDHKMRRTHGHLRRQRGLADRADRLPRRFRMEALLTAQERMLETQAQSQAATQDVMLKAQAALVELEAASAPAQITSRIRGRVKDLD